MCFDILYGGGKATSKNIFICLNPFISHFAPTLAIAHQLREQGGCVHFIGFLDLKEVVVKEGFDFYAIKSHTNKEIVLSQKSRAYVELGEIYKDIHNEIEKIFKENDADIALIGVSRFLIYFMPAVSNGMKIYFYSLCEGTPSVKSTCPPVTSNYIPEKNSSNLICYIEWGKRFLRKGLSPKVLYSKLFYPWPQIKKICKSKRIHWKFGIDGFFPDFPIIILGSKYMDFKYQYTCDYAGLCIDTKRDGTSTSENNKYRAFCEDRNKPLIYCCMGTMSSRYININNFYSALIKVFMENSQWKLLISLGKRGASLNYEGISENIVIVDYVNQLEVLKYASMMITHGGHGSVKECVHSAVPILAFPCSYDQRGNAARVQYHQIGRRSTILEKSLFQRLTGRGEKRILSSDIKPLIEEVLECKQYRINIQRMRDVISEDIEIVRAVKSILQ